jgi:glycosyltransferase involved in cell wall biosynthesis
MLSSLIEQVNPALLVVDVAHMPDNGNPRTEDVVEHFSGRLHIKDSRWTDYSTFQKRGWVRNRQLTECATEWIVFADTDMVYHPEYFSRLITELKSNHAQATYMLSSGRLSNPKEAANALVNAAVDGQSTYIPDAFKLAQTLPPIVKRNVGAGFSQIINFYHAPHGGYYVEPDRNPDWDWESRFQKARSDISFRKRIGKLGGPRRKLPRWFSDNLIHLNHHRDNQFGYHLEEQR